MTVDYSYIRSKKAKKQEAYLGTIREREDLQAWTYENADILPLKRLPGDDPLAGRGGVIFNGTYVEESATHERPHGTYPYTVARTREEKVVYCGYLIRQWGHFLVDAITRLWYLTKNDASVEKYVFITEENGERELQGNYRRFFELLGISDKLELINEPTRFRTVVVPEMGFYTRYARCYYGAAFKKILDTVAENAEKTCSDALQRLSIGKKIFLSKGQYGKAKATELGVEMLDDYFARNGFTVLAPEKLTLGEMICAIRQSEVCVSTSDSIAHNMLFARDGQTVVTIDRQPTVHYSQAAIGHMRRLQVTYIDANYLIFPATAGGGPFFFAYNRHFQRYSAQNGYLPPNESYTCEKYLSRCIRRYMKMYRQQYGYKWGLEDWAADLFGDVYYEAYKDSEGALAPWLTGEKAFALWQRFTLRYLKHAARRLLKRS